MDIIENIMSSIDHFCEAGIGLELFLGRLSGSDVTLLIREALSQEVFLDLSRIKEYREFFGVVDVTYSGAGTPLYSVIPEDCCDKCFEQKLGSYLYKGNYKLFVDRIRNSGSNIGAGKNQKVA